MFGLNCGKELLFFPETFPFYFVTFFYGLTFRLSVILFYFLKRKVFLFFITCFAFLTVVLLSFCIDRLIDLICTSGPA